jgi:Glyoxalase-like domain
MTRETTSQMLRGGREGQPLASTGTRHRSLARDQMHLDLHGDDASQQVNLVLGLGARPVRENDDPEDTYVVMRDPEGDEFCLCSLPSI